MQRNICSKVCRSNAVSYRTSVITHIVFCVIFQINAESNLLLIGIFFLETLDDPSHNLQSQ